MALPASALQGLAFDARSLDALRRDASRDPQAAVREAAGQFEALFMQQLLKSMRDAMPKSGLFKGPGQETYVGMLDQQLSQSLSSRPGGLADMIARQLAHHIGVPPAGAAAGPEDSAGKEPPAARKLSYEQPAATWQPLDSAMANRLKESLNARLESPQAAFVDRMWSHAVASERNTGIAAAFVVGQAALESGWGKHEIRHADGRSSHNLFGIKASRSWSGPTVDVTTTEYVDGKPTRSVERFRSYSSYAEAFDDWASLMSGKARYATVLRNGRSPEGFAQGLQRAGYATDPHYADKLESTIHQTLKLKRLSV